MTLPNFALLFGMVMGYAHCQTDPGLTDTVIVSEHKLPSTFGMQFRGSSSPSPNCFCLPVNQACPSTPISAILKVSNSGSDSLCADSGQKMCCPSGGSISVSSLSPNSAIPNPRNPIPGSAPNSNVPPTAEFTSFSGAGSCGISNPVPYRQAKFPEADFGEYPWMAIVLDLDNKYLGGGVLIAPGWVLTAAHIIPTVQGIRTKVRLGDYDVQTRLDHPEIPHVEAAVDEIITHPNFDQKNLVNDVALLRVHPVDVTTNPHIGTVCLPEHGQLFFNSNENCWVTGWGKDKFLNGSYQNILKEVDVPMVDPFVCESRLQRTRLGPTFTLNSKVFICAGGIPGKDACTGDGGSPLVCPSTRGWTVVGLVAWGIGCSQPEIPGVYVNVANYVDFIRQYVRS